MVGSNAGNVMLRIAKRHFDFHAFSSAYERRFGSTEDGWPKSKGTMINKSENRRGRATAA